MNALDKVWELVGSNNTLLGLAFMAVVIVHIVLLTLSAAVLMLAVWSLFRVDRQWKPSSYVAIVAAVGYLVVTWYALW